MTHHGDPISWRPQVARPAHRAREIVDPIIEPLWDGNHVLVHFQAGRVRLVDAGGKDVGRDFPLIVTAVREAISADDAVIDGWLSDQPTRTGVGVVPVAVETPRGMGLIRPQRPGPAPELPHDRENLVAFVAVDLLRLDGEELLDVPLLERKRLLEQVVAAGDLVRVTPFVRPPLEGWLNSWKAAGFAGAILKAANSRYVPGRETDEWYVALPRR
ncbi:MAG: hypothetical protein A2X23_12665 [Chloroflexi bacterium GWC2_73_18]|nr:MAG: hypothetical protein A2X23_12665 [Chloroflexi bacterium GWC2_73_18]